MDGLLNVCKPSGITSYDVIRYLKKILRPYAPKIGHTGTLDPFASGVLLVLLGKATKLASQFLKCEKTYQGTIILGVETTTADITGREVRRALLEKNLDLEDLQQLAREFIGEIEQIPPMYCALHYQGMRLYKLARQNITVERKARKAIIYHFKILDFQSPKIDFEVRVSGGTYVRVLAQDFAHRLGTYGFLSSLTRISVGDFVLAESVKLEDLNTLEDLRRCLKFFQLI